MDRSGLSTQEQEILNRLEAYGLLVRELKLAGDNLCRAVVERESQFVLAVLATDYRECSQRLDEFSQS
jgi:hypothetical protein